MYVYMCRTFHGIIEPAKAIEATTGLMKTGIPLSNC
jgi:hypothetical protein